MRRVAFGLAIAALLVLSAVADAAPVQLDRAQVTTRIGREFTFTSTIKNPENRPLTGLVAHLNVLSVDPGVYVDPEDWSSHRTRYLPTVPAQGSVRVSWTVKAVNSGSFAVYVAVLPRHGADTIEVSEPLRVDVGRRRTLNSGGVLPLAFGVPGFLALVALGARTRRRRIVGD